MKKIFLSFGLIVAFALFATFSRRNIGVGADRFLTPNVSVLAPTGQNNEPPAVADTAGPAYIPKRVLNYFSDDSEGEGEDGRVRTSTQTAPAPTPAPAPATTPTKPTTTTNSGQFKNGTYTGSVADAYYGNIQVQAIITGGKLTDVIFLQHPNDRRTSIEINTQAMPILKSEAISIQSGNVDIVSGATDSSLAFRESMSSALLKAKN